MPISEIIRPLPSQLNEEKVQSIAEVLKVKYILNSTAIKLCFLRSTARMFHQSMFFGLKALKAETTSIHLAVAIVTRPTKKLRNQKFA